MIEYLYSQLIKKIPIYFCICCTHIFKFWFLLHKKKQENRKETKNQPLRFIFLFYKFFVVIKSLLLYQNHWGIAYGERVGGWGVTYCIVTGNT